MRIVVQKVDSAVARCGQRMLASIGKGIVLYIGISKDECPGADKWLIEELTKIKAAQDQILCLSQFTLFGMFKGPKPSFHRAERPEIAEPYFSEIVEKIKDAFDCRVERGLFGKVLQVELRGMGMETLLLERPATGKVAG